MAALAPLVVLALGMLLAFGVFGLRRAGVSVPVITGGFLIAGGVVLAVVALLDANRMGEPDGVVSAVLAAGCLVAGALLAGAGPRG